ncbi:MAG: gliding motility-associated C-terminal domain-containing protein [Ekhidna sp.]|uniref:T9SS type B sorting domain-containing protein n=1 Tax=Ekhidna sp. TaxID=2608089 RepID=UPI0032EFD8C7
MLRFQALLALFTFSGHVLSQSVTFGDQTSLYLGQGTIFFFGGNTTLDGTLSNSGTIVSYSDIDLVLNTDIGNIKFTGRADQNINGGVLEVGDFIVDKQGKLTLLTEQIIVSGSLVTENGVIDAEEDDDILVSGSSQGTGQGYVEGKLVGISRGNPVTFPMGVNGSPNYVTISNLPNNAIVSVECKIPDANQLFPDEDIVGISDEVEWVLKVTGDSVQAQVSVSFSGVDLQNLSNGENIRAFDYEPAIVLFSKTDTLFHALNGVVRDTDASFSEGAITSDQSIWITNEGRRMAIALVPVIVEPTFYVPNAFSPNGTIEDNRRFRPYFAGAIVSSFSFSVYDSFNKEVYSANQSNDEVDISQFGWNGILNSGQEAPEGVYYYKVRIVADSEEYTKTGSVLLVK